MFRSPVADGKWKEKVKMTARRGLLLEVLLVLGLGLLFVGCANPAKLQARNKQLDALARDLKQQNIALEKEAAELKGENQLLRDRLAQKAATPAPGAQYTSSLEEKLAGTGAEVEMRGGRVVVTLLQQVFFASGSAAITSAGQKSLLQVGSAIKSEFPDQMISIQGHTDNEPIKRTKDLYKSNWELSTARALSVLHFMIEKVGLSAERCYVAGFGEYQPVATNATSEGRSKNRRVEIVIVPAGASS